MEILKHIRDGAFVEMVIFAGYCPRCRKLMIPSTLTQAESEVNRIARINGYDAQTQMNNLIAAAAEDGGEVRLTYVAGVACVHEMCSPCKAEVDKEKARKRNTCLHCGHEFNKTERGKIRRDLEENGLICMACYEVMTARQYVETIEKAIGHKFDKYEWEY